MANAAVAWDQRPDYLAYTDWTPIPGVTSYVVPRNGTGTNVTQYHPGQAFLSEHNLPDIMYELHPCGEWRRFKDSPLPGPKQNPDGSLISTEEAWWYHEFVRRMDPRIRQMDIIMREEVSAERLRMSDLRYINLHLSTPGYRTYRPAWKMLSWQVTSGSAMQNDRRQSVLDSLTDAQKTANTTRGSTPGLINPGLGDVAGNRVPLPVLRLRKRGPRHARGNANNTPATQPVQPARARTNAQAPPTPQAPPAPPAPPAYQVYQAPQTSQGALNDLQQQQHPQASSSHLATAPFPVASATMDAPPQDFSSMAAAQGQNHLGGYADIQARDAAAMPPPPLPLKCRNSQLPRPHVSRPQPDLPYSTNGLAEFLDTQFDVVEVKDTEQHVPESGHPLMSDEEIATMSAKSEEAMTAILRICEPILGSCSNLQDPPPMDLSAELIDDLGMGFMFPCREYGKERGEEKGNAMQARWNTAQPTTPMLSKKQGTKRKECDDGDEDYQHVQLDVERQANRPIKRVKSMPDADFQNNYTMFHNDPIYNTQQQHLDPQPADYQSGYGYGQVFDGSALQYPWVEEAVPYTGAPYEEQYGGMAEQHFAPQPADYQSGYDHGQVFDGHTLEHAWVEEADPYTGAQYEEQYGGMTEQDFAPQLADHQSGYSHGQIFDDPALQHPWVEEADPYTGAQYEEQYGGMTEQDFAPQLADHQSGYSHGQIFDDPALQHPWVEEADPYTVQQWDQIIEPNDIEQYSAAPPRDSLPG